VTLRRSLADGAVTGLAFTAAVQAGCAVLGTAPVRCSEYVFLGGGLLAVLSSVWALAGYSSPPGVVSLLSGSAEVYPPPPDGRLWLDRFLHPGNVWLIAGLVAVAASFVMAAR
jgi:hypothetical protein